MKYVIVGVLLVAVLIIGIRIYNNPPPQVGENNTQGSRPKNSETMQSDEKKQSRYVNYSQSTFEAAKDKKRVYYFHANWCPICKEINKEFETKADQIPADVIVFKTDYDTEKALKQQYGIPYQHTFVYVDATGKELKKWNGGSLAEIIANTR